MSPKIINSSRYKKTTKKQANKKKGSIPINNIIETKSTKLVKYKKRRIKSKSLGNSTSGVGSKILKISIGIVVIALIGFLSQRIVKLEDIQILNVFSNKDETISLENGYIFNIGLSKLDNTNELLSRNAIYNELISKSYNSLVVVNKDYSFRYVIAKDIEKVSNKEYIVKLADDTKITISDIEKSINKIKNAGESNVHYKNVNNIESITSLGEKILKFMLKEENPYFVYTLNFPIYITNLAEYNLKNINSNDVTFEKNNSLSTINNVNIINFGDVDTLVNEFKEERVDMFVTSSDLAIQYIGKHEYNIKKYRDGESYILFGNKNSKLFSKKEVRQALAYSINRDEIVKVIGSSFSEPIDIPYVYSQIKYKYDIYGAENILLSNGWKKSGGIYSKYEDNQNLVLNLKLLVNSNDSNKIKIAENIRQMVEQIGIKIEVIKLNDEEMKANVDIRNYDLVLSTVYTNENPDIRFLNEYININDNVNNAMEQINVSDVKNLSMNVQKLQEVLSNEIACIGIVSKDTALVYQKYITGFENLGYMKVFENIDKIGKISN